MSLKKNLEITALVLGIGLFNMSVVPKIANVVFPSINYSSIHQNYKGTNPVPPINKYQNKETTPSQ